MTPQARRTATAGFALLVALAALPGCTSAGDSQRHYDGAADSLKAVDTATAGNRGAQDVQPVRKGAMPYLGHARVDDAHGDPLPNRVEGTDGFSITEGTRSLQALASAITVGLGIPVVISNASPTTKPGAAPSQPGRASDDNPAEEINKLLRTTQDLAPSPARPHITVEKLYLGPLSRFLTAHLPQADLDWEYRDGTIYFTHEFTRSYRISDFPSSTTISAALSGATTGAGSTGSIGSTGAAPGVGGAAVTGGTGGQGTGQNSTTTSKIDSWADLTEALKAIAQDGKVVPDKADQKIVVTCPRHCHADVKAYIDEHNRDVTRLVYVSVAIVSIGSTGSDSYGFDPTLLYNNLPHGYSLSVLGQTALPTTTGAGSLTGAILNPPTGSTAARFSGTSLAIQALTESGSNSLRFARQGVTGDNRVISLRDGIDYPYLINSGTAISTAAATSSSTVAILPIGNQVQVLPHLTSDGMIRLQVAVTRTTLVALIPFDLGGGATNSVPETSDNSNSTLEFSIRDGATLILADASDSSGNQANGGAGSIYNWLLGGTANANTSSDRTVMLLTAREWRPEVADSGNIPGL